jgi:hypothetical protein
MHKVRSLRNLGSLIKESKNKKRSHVNFDTKKL